MNSALVEDDRKIIPLVARVEHLLFERPGRGVPSIMP